MVYLCRKVFGKMKGRGNENRGKEKKREGKESGNPE
jgi:hypothetical protein